MCAYICARVCVCYGWLCSCVSIDLTPGPAGVPGLLNVDYTQTSWLSGGFTETWGLNEPSRCFPDVTEEEEEEEEGLELRAWIARTSMHTLMALFTSLQHLRAALPSLPSSCLSCPVPVLPPALLPASTPALKWKQRAGSGLESIASCIRPGMCDTPLPLARPRCPSPSYHLSFIFFLTFWCSL